MNYKRVKLIKLKIVICAIFLLQFGCKKDDKGKEQTEIPNPMTSKNGWELVKHTPEFHTYTSGIRSLDLVKEHSEGIDILYSTIFNFQDLQFVNVRWRAYHNDEHIVRKVKLTEYSLDYLNRAIPSTLLDVYSKGLGENDLFAMYEQRYEPGGGRLFYKFKYFNVKTIQNSISEFAPNENVSSLFRIGKANPQHPFVSGGYTQQFNESIPIYNSSFAAAPKGKELVMLSVNNTDNLLTISESTNKNVLQKISAQDVLVRPVVIKNIFDLSQFTNSNSQNEVILSKFFSDNNYLYVFLGLNNKKHRFFKINLKNYTLTSDNESMYEQIDLVGIKNIILLEDRPGQLLSMEKDGIYLIANNSKTFVASPSIKVGSTGTTVYYSNGKIWQVLFDENGAYLISKAI